MVNDIRSATASAVETTAPNLPPSVTDVPGAADARQRRKTAGRIRRLLGTAVLGGALAIGMRLGYQPTVVQAQAGCIDAATVSCTNSTYYGVGNYSTSEHCFNVQITNMYPSTPCAWSCTNRFSFVSAIATFHSTTPFPGVNEDDVVGTVSIDFLDPDLMQFRTVTADLLFRQGISGYSPPWVTGMIPVSGGASSHVPIRMKMRPHEYPISTSYSFDPAFVAGAPDGSAIVAAYVSINCPNE